MYKWVGALAVNFDPKTAENYLDLLLKPIYRELSQEQKVAGELLFVTYKTDTTSLCWFTSMAALFAVALYDLVDILTLDKHREPHHD